MHPTSTLHALLHSLTQAEKRFLRLYAARHVRARESHAAWLLDRIWAQEAYDEAALKQAWAADGHDPRHFAAAKHYLYALALQAMRDCHRAADPRRVTADLLADARFLHARNLNQAAERRIQKAMDMALQHELPDLHVQALALARTLALRGDPAQARLTLATLDADMHAALTRMQAIAQGQAIVGQATIAARQQIAPRDPDGRAVLQDLQVKALAIAEAHPLAFFPRYYALRTQAIVAQLTGDAQVLWDLQEALIQLWRAFPHMQPPHSKLYLLTLINALGAYQATDRYADMLLLLHDLGKFTPASPQEEVEQTQNLAYFDLLHAMNVGEWDRAAQASLKVQEVEAAHGQDIPKARRTAMAYLVAITHFFMENHRAALAALGVILNDAAHGSRRDIQQSARLLQAIVHYELGNVDLLEYLLRGLRRYLKTRDGLHTFEAQLLQALTRLIAHPAEKTSILENLRDEVSALLAEPGRGEVLGLEEVGHWVNAKLQGRPLREMIQAQAAR